MALVRTGLHKSSTRNTPKTRRSQNSYFAKWEAFTERHGQDSTLSAINDPETKVCWILMFACMYRQRPGPTGDPVRSETVGKACLAVGYQISLLVGPNPCKAKQGHKEFHPIFADCIKKLKDEDKPSSRAYPINLAIIEGIADALNFDDPVYGSRERHVFDLCIMAWF